MNIQLDGPGVTIDDIGKVARVEHTIDADHIRTRIWTDIAASERGIRESIAAIVRHVLIGTGARQPQVGNRLHVDPVAGRLLSASFAAGANFGLTVLFTWTVPVDESA